MLFNGRALLHLTTVKGAASDLTGHLLSMQLHIFFLPKVYFHLLK